MRSIPFRLLAVLLVSCAGESPELPVVRSAGQETGAAAMPGVLAPVPARSSGREVEAPTANEDRPLVDPLVVRGEVVDARGGRGVEGITILLIHDLGRFRATSDAAGRFEVRVPRDEGAVRLWVGVKTGWRWRGDWPYPQRGLSPEERSGEAPLRIEVAERLARPVHGVAIDAETGAPLPRFPFNVQHGSRPSVVTSILTDEEGRFVSDVAIVGGKVGLRPGRGEGWPVRNQLDLFHDGAPLTLAFHAGPRIPVRLVGHAPAEVEDLQLVVLRRGQAKPCAKTHLRVDPNGNLWARPPLARDRPAASEVVSLFVADEVGHRIGHVEARWSDLRGAHDAPPLVFPMQLAGAVRATTNLADARPLEDDEISFPRSGDRVRVRTEVPGATFPGASWRCSAGKWLPPGEVRVSAAARSYAAAEALVEITPDATTEVELTLRPTADRRRVRGRVRTKTGTAFDQAHVYVALRDDPSRRWSVSWERQRFCGTGLDYAMREQVVGGVPTARFELESVPPGPLVVTASRWASLPASIEIHGDPSGDVEIDIVLQDGEDVRGFGMRATDAETGEPLSFIANGRVLDGGPPLATGGPWLGLGDPRDCTFEWAVQKAGWRPAYGTHRDFECDDGGSWWAEVALVKGWGTRLEVVDPEGAPVPGATVLLDGSEAGLTDAAGQLELAAETKPLGIEVRSPGGEVVVHVPDHAPWQTARVRGR